MTGWLPILALAIWSLAAPANPAVAQTQKDDLASLRGLPGVGVAILGLPARTTDTAVLTTRDIQADVEAQLRQAGIRLLSPAELAAIPSRPYVQIDFSFVSTPAPSDIDFYIVQLTLRQSAVLTSGQPLSVRTFQDAMAEWTARADRGKRLRAAVKEEVSRFVNAWGIANRK